MRAKKVGTIIFVTDERLSREKSSLLARTLNAIRMIAQLEILSGSISEEDLLKKLEEKTPNLVLAPWYRYMNWSRVEAFYGLTRTSGPTFAGYFADTLLPYEVGEQPDYFRTILLDFANATPPEAVTLLKALLLENRRAGILPLLEPDTSVYCENWYTGIGLGMRMDAIMGLPEIANYEWSRRGNSIRICLNALWSLIYEEGPGKSEFHQTITANSPKAYFQIAADRKFLLMRLCYAMPSWSPKDLLRVLWPKNGKPSSPGQLLLKHADFVRAHRVVENNDIELVVGLALSDVADTAAEQMHTLWIEPISASLVLEIPYEAPSPTSKYLKLLPTVSLTDNKLHSEAGSQVREKFIVEAAVKIRDLKKLLNEREELIRELRAGGVGTAQPLPPPDMEALLEAFQERFFDARYQIRQFELQISEMEQKGTTTDEVDSLRRKMGALAKREEAWLESLSAIIEGVKLTKIG